ncbi:hypothetical protein Bbelb_171610 [Branchiostoma belcheri]|nr:hypothetical protein Bbelb_171610 [Branchiostoma belcheri]
MGSLPFTFFVTGQTNRMQAAAIRERKRDDNDAGKSEENKTPSGPETGGGGREELATADVKFEDEETKKNSPETAEGSDDVEGRSGKKRKPWKKRHWKRKKRGEQEAEVPEVIMLTPKQKAPTIEDLQREVEEAQGIVRNNVEKLVNEREQRLGSLLEKGERLEDAAADFAKVSRRVRIKLCLRAHKWRIAAAVGEERVETDKNRWSRAGARTHDLPSTSFKLRRSLNHSAEKV